MTQVYSDPARENEPYALPNVEVFYVNEFDYIEAERAGWYWWSCFPGCLPDGEPSGPFDIEQEAVNDAQDYFS